MSILYLPTQIQMDIVHQKPSFKHKFLRLLMNKNKYSSKLFRKNMY